MALTFDNIPTAKQWQELIKTINHELDQGNLVRLVNYWDIPNGLTIIQRVIPASKRARSGSILNAEPTIEQIAALPRVILYPGYLSLCRPGTPSRVIAIMDCGDFREQHLQQAQAYRLCMNHTYNKHDFPDDEQFN